MPISLSKSASKWQRGVVSTLAMAVLMPTLSPTTFAATSTVTWLRKSIDFASYSAPSVPSYVEHGTTYMPVWYVLQGLKQSGYNYSFNGKVLNITPPAGVTPNTSNLPMGAGNLTIEFNGTVVKQVQTEVRRDGSNGNLTQFIPIYYIQQILRALSFDNQWDGTTWTGERVTLNLSGNDAVQAGQLDAFAFSMTDANGHYMMPNGSVTWSVTGGNGQASIDTNTGIFEANSTGTYQVTASVDGFFATQQVEVYGTPVGVRLSESDSSLTTDGIATKTITVQAIDASGNVVEDFAGQVTLSIPSLGGSFVDGLTSGSNSEAVVSLYNGQGTATLTAPIANPGTTESITSSSLISSTDTLPTSPVYGSASVSYLSPVVSSIQVTPDSSTLVSNTANSMNLHVSLLDAAGNTLTSGITSPVYVTFTINGPASFASGMSLTTISQYVYPGTGAVIPVYALAGQQGNVTVSAAGDGVTGSTSFTTQVTGTAVASNLQVTKTTGTLATALTVTPSGGSGSTTLPAGTTYTLYTVQVVDSNGNAIPAAHTLWVSDSTFSASSIDALTYYAVQGNTPSTPLSVVESGIYSLTTSAATGRGQFIVFNTGNAPSGTTITMKDVTAGITATTN